METKITKHKDAMPLVLTVLFKVSNLWLFMAHERAIDRYYPDLKGLLDTDELTDEALDLIENSDDLPGMLMMNGIHEINDYIGDRVDYYAITLINMRGDTDTELRGWEICQSLVNYIKPDQPIRLTFAVFQGFTAYVAQVIYRLCEFLLHGDFNNSYVLQTNEHADPFCPNFKVMLDSNDCEVKLLAAVGKFIAETHSDFTALRRIFNNMDF